MQMGLDIAGFSGAPPPHAPWGTEEVRCSPDLQRRLQELSPKRPEVCIVFGAGGALGRKSGAPAFFSTRRSRRKARPATKKATGRAPKMVQRKSVLWRKIQSSRILRSRAAGAKIFEC